MRSWLFDNVKNMSPDMFDDLSVDWMLFDIEEVLLMRGLAPEGVFVRNAKTAYAQRVRGSAQLLDMAEALFEDDYTLIERWPPHVARDYKKTFIGLCMIAYSMGLRPAEPRVQRM